MTHFTVKPKSLYVVCQCSVHSKVDLCVGAREAISMYGSTRASTGWRLNKSTVDIFGELSKETVKKKHTMLNKMLMHMFFCEITHHNEFDFTNSINKVGLSARQGVTSLLVKGKED